MGVDAPTIAEAESLGRQRLEQLTAFAASHPNDLAWLPELSWLRFSEVIDHDLVDRGGFSAALVETIDILRELAIYQRGPGILGFLNHMELSFSMRVDASYVPQSRVFHLNLGLLLYLNELAACCEWLESLIQESIRGAVPIRELVSRPIPPAVCEELAILSRISKSGDMPVSERRGLTSPIGIMMMRFLVAHELAHLVDYAESPQLRENWRATAWQDYQDALQFGVASGWFGRERYEQLQPQALPEAMAGHWVTEFVADGMGFYTVRQAEARRAPEPELSYAHLQAAVELFFWSLVLAYRKDLGTETHPPPTLRATVIRARSRKDHRVDWGEFLSTRWNTGFMVSTALEKAIRSLPKE